jgi:hypothetical protein
VHDSGRAANPTARAFAWVGAGVFVLSLSYFIYQYWTAFGAVAPGPFSASPVVWNVLLFTGFAAHHSVFARTPLKQWLARAVGPLERSVYVWIASLLFAGVCWLWQPVSGVVWDLDGAARLVLFFLQLGGITLSVYSAALIDIWELAGTKQIDSQPPTSNNDQMDFKTTGPYGLVRHPIYLGWFLIVLCVGTMTMTRLVFAVVSCVYIVVAIPFEERSLLKSAGDAYARYMKRVPAKLIPRLY